MTTRIRIGLPANDSITCDGSVSFVTLPSAARVTASQDITLATWCNFPVTKASNRFMTKFYGSGGGGRSGSLGLGNPASGGAVATGFFFFIRDAALNSFTLASGIPYTLGTWEHVVGSWNQTSGVMKIYQKGILANVLTGVFGPGDGSTSPPKLLNTDTGAPQSVSGSLWGSRVYTRELTEREVLEMYYNDVASRTGLNGEYLYTELDGQPVVDSSGNGYNGTITGVPTHSTSQPSQASARTLAGPRTRVTTPRRIRVRDFGTALTFGTGTSRVDATYIPGLAQGGTFACYFKATDLTANIQLLNVSINTNDRFCVDISSSGSLRGLYFTPVVGNVSSAVSSVVINRWYHGVYTFDGVATGKVYLNGADVTSGTSNAGTAAGSTTEIGGRGNSNIFKGNIDEPRIWNRPLTASEVADLYYNKQVPPLGLKIQLLFNEGSGATAIDSSGNGNNGVIASCTYSADVPGVGRTRVT